MAVLKCKMCGGDLKITEGASTAECEYCGSVQTVPRADNEKKMTLFGRAGRLRTACEFDKAAGIYEAILTDFPEEAEAYWGLVLCKYGIEYVESPSDGRRVPTCHRSSYDSVLEDDNFEQAMENADVIARRLYRAEAMELERLRKGILEVSSAEEPYDIFICYKETDENGDRTLDSVLAQDLYAALTEKGYRVFFSRITLKGKLGMDYEPYIFSALNSAKVMLAVGTRYEFFNAVWVKNEWSRYLKICEEDKEKHLIPCYRDISASDMPREFNHLQGADLGKMGAVQDILFNMGKYIPRQKETPVVQSAAAGGKDQLLKRGKMSLEDRAWAEAEKHFEEVLNRDAECAEAYVGKALAQARCGSLREMAVAQVNRAVNELKKQKLSIPSDEGRISMSVTNNAVPGYLEAAEIRKRYSFDLTYESGVEAWQQQKEEVLKRWNENRFLHRAAQFADGELARMLEEARAQLGSELEEKSTVLREEENRARNELGQRYAAFLNQVDGVLAQKSAEAKDQIQQNRENSLKSLRGLLNENENLLAERRKGLKGMSITGWVIGALVLTVLFISHMVNQPGSQSNSAMFLTYLVWIIVIVINNHKVGKMWKKFGSRCAGNLFQKITENQKRKLLIAYLKNSIVEYESAVQTIRTQIQTLERGGAVQTGGFDMGIFQDFYGNGMR